jgi:hypothetical protein
VAYDHNNLPVVLSMARRTPSFEPKITFFPNISGAASREEPASKLHFILPSLPTAIRLPFSFPKKMVSSLMTGDDLVLVPVVMLHKRDGDDGSSDADFPARSGFPRNNGHSDSAFWAPISVRMEKRKNIITAYLIYRTLLKLT